MLQAQGRAKEGEEQDNSELVLLEICQTHKRARSSGAVELVTTAAPVPFFRASSPSSWEKRSWSREGLEEIPPHQQWHVNNLVEREQALDSTVIAFLSSVTDIALPF